MTLLRLPRLALTALACVVLIGAGAPAADANKKKDDDAKSDSYWTIAFLGGVVMPQRNTADTHKQGLAAGGHIGWTAGNGLGVRVAGDYSPLPRLETDVRESFETHFGLITLQPMYTLRWKSLRLWVGGGAGIAAERTRLNDADTMSGERRTDYSLAATGSSGLEIHLFSGGGVAVTGSYSKLFDKVGFVRDRTYKLVNVTGGLVFAFR